MKKFIKTIISIFADIFRGILYFVENNLRNFARIINFLLPYVMYLSGQVVCETRGFLVVGLELLIPIVISFIVFFIRAYADKIGKGTEIPVPENRFTQVSDYGEVTVDNERLYEMILYMADIENYLQRRGLL